MPCNIKKIKKESVAAEWPEKYGEQLFRYAQRRLSDKNTARDVVQETFVAGMKSKSNFDAQGSLRGWLFGILKHKIVDECRIHYREHVEDNLTISKKINCYSDGDPSQQNYVIAGQQPASPYEVIKGKELRKLCEDGMSQMPQNLANTFKLHVLEGLTVSEISDELSISRNNVWVRLHRARKSLQKHVKNEWPAAAH